MNLEPDFNIRNNDQQALACSWLSALNEPAALIQTTGELLEVNRAFRRKFAEAASGRNLGDFLSEPREQFQREVQIECSVQDVRLPNDMCTPLALIVNELVTNALKHARLKSGPLKVEVRLSAFSDAAVLEVQDNGSGFHAPSVWKRGSGIGLVKGLVRQLRGKLTIDSQEGTLFSVSFPLRQAE